MCVVLGREVVKDEHHVEVEQPVHLAGSHVDEVAHELQPDDDLKSHSALSFVRAVYLAKFTILSYKLRCYLEDESWFIKVSSDGNLAYKII